MAKIPEVPGAALKPAARAIRLGLIGLVLAGCGSAFAYTAGWLGQPRLGPQRLVDALEAHDGRHDSFRRAHAKGICFTGYFESDGQGMRLSQASVFNPGRYPVIGRFSTGGGIPNAGDGRNVFHSLALSFSLPHGEQWRTAMNHVPIFPVATPQAFYEFQQATTPDPATGKPDPAKLQAYLAAHPETRAFMQWLKDNPLPSSFTNADYYSVNAFLFTNAAGQERAVRWSFVPEARFEALDKDHLPQQPRDFLFDDLVTRLDHGPARWSLRLTPAEDGDPVNDATQAWPQDRPYVEAGTLVVQRAALEDDGACRDITFDPLILPRGIAASDDPLLAARSAAYSVSLRRRSGEPLQASALAQAAVEPHP